MHVFVVLGLVFNFIITSREIGLGKRLRNDLFCVEWDVKPQLNRSINHNQVCVQHSAAAGSMTLLLLLIAMLL